jgi:TolA-binding protein
MPKHLLPLLLVPVLSACATQPEPPPAEVPLQPLVIGTSAAPPPAPTPPVTRDAPVAAAPVTPLAIAARDPRRQQPERLALIRIEMPRLESLVAATSVGSPDRAALLRRIADDHAELARAEAADVAVTSHKAAAKTYDLLVAEGPQQRDLDEAYYLAGLEHELAGDAMQARRHYYEVIKQFPNSKLVALCYFAFGELFLAESDAEPLKLDLAEQAYVEVLKYPPPANAVFADAQRRRQEVKERRSGAPAIRRP